MLGLGEAWGGVLLWLEAGESPRAVADQVLKGVSCSWARCCSCCWAIS